MDTVPCKNCIVLSMCSARLTNHPEYNSELKFSSTPFYVVLKKCSLLYNWIHRWQDADNRFHRMLKAYKYINKNHEQ